MTIRGLQRLLMILGGKVAAEYREIVESVFTRYTAGGSGIFGVFGIFGIFGVFGIFTPARSGSFDHSIIRSFDHQTL